MFGRFRICNKAKVTGVEVLGDIDIFRLLFKLIRGFVELFRIVRKVRE